MFIERLTLSQKGVLQFSFSPFLPFDRLRLLPIKFLRRNERRRTFEDPF